MSETPIGYTTLETFEAGLKKVAANHSLTLNAADEDVAEQRLTNAYNIVLGRLIARGLDKAAADTWIRGAEFQLDIATYWYGISSGWLRQNTDERAWLEAFNREEELETVTLLDSDFEQLADGDDVPARVWNIEEDS